MKIVEKIKAKQADIYNAPPVTIGFLGDSVTQGCFEIYKTGPESLQTVFEPKHAYSTKLREMLALLFPNVQINIINSGIIGMVGSSTGRRCRLVRLWCTEGNCETMEDSLEESSAKGDPAATSSAEGTTSDEEETSVRCLMFSKYTSGA